MTFLIANLFRYGSLVIFNDLINFWEKFNKIGESIFRVRVLYLITHAIWWHRSFLAHAITEGLTEGPMDSASVRVFTSSFAYNFVGK